MDKIDASVKMESKQLKISEIFSSNDNKPEDSFDKVTWELDSVQRTNETTILKIVPKDVTAFYEQVLKFQQFMVMACSGLFSAKFIDLKPVPIKENMRDINPMAKDIQHFLDMCVIGDPMQYYAFIKWLWIHLREKFYLSFVQYQYIRQMIRFKAILTILSLHVDNFPINPAIDITKNLANSFVLNIPRYSLQEWLCHPTTCVPPIHKIILGRNNIPQWQTNIKKKVSESYQKTYLCVLQKLSFALGYVTIKLDIKSCVHHRIYDIDYKKDTIILVSTEDCLRYKAITQCAQDVPKMEGLQMYREAPRDTNEIFTIMKCCIHDSNSLDMFKTDEEHSWDHTTFGSSLQKNKVIFPNSLPNKDDSGDESDDIEVPRKKFCDKDRLINSRIQI